jgi:quercetin dioxygenase-like cupin family protein
MGAGMSGTDIFHWDQILPYGDEKADRRLITGGGGDVKRVMVKAGTVAARHEHDFEQFFLVITGTGVLTIAEGDVVLKPGVVVHFQPFVWHKAIFETDTVLVEVNFRQVEG